MTSRKMRLLKLCSPPYVFSPRPTSTSRGQVGSRPEGMVGVNVEDVTRELQTNPLDLRQLPRVLDEALLDAALTEGDR